MAQLVQHQPRPTSPRLAAVAFAALVIGGIIGGTAATRLPLLAQPVPLPAITIAGQGGTTVHVVPPVHAVRPVTDSPYVNRLEWGGK